MKHLYQNVDLNHSISGSQDPHQGPSRWKKMIVHNFVVGPPLSQNEKFTASTHKIFAEVLQATDKQT